MIVPLESFRTCALTTQAAPPRGSYRRHVIAKILVELQAEEKVNRHSRTT